MIINRGGIRCRLKIRVLAKGIGELIDADNRPAE